jgi:murein DD-endopeptidase MepM/ murein hydrolase activator NlpD
MLRNGSFEGGWYHPQSIPELQIPNEWVFSWKGPSTPNPFDSNPWAEFHRPEVRVLPKAQLPPEEHDLFILDGDHCLKVFGSSWWGTFVQQVELESGQYELSLNVFADLVKEYVDGQKVWADDPEGRDGLVRVTVRSGFADQSDWMSLEPGSWNTVSRTIVVPDKTTVWIEIEFMCPFPLKSNGIFADSWSLTRTSDTPDDECPRAREPYNRTYVLLPQELKESDARRAFELAYPWRLTVGSSADDAGISTVGLMNRDVIALRPDDWAGAGELEEFFAKHYPGVAMHRVGWDNSVRLSGRLVASILKTRGLSLAYPAALVPHYVTGEFGEPRHTYIHKGLDLRASYDPVKAMLTGVVIREEMDESASPYGIHVIVESDFNGEKIQCRYAHLDTIDPSVVLGQVIERGQVLGVSGNTGNSTAAHLHVDVRYVGKGLDLFIDPDLLIDYPSAAEPPPPQIPSVSAKKLLGLHIQTTVPEWLDYVADVQPRVVKLVGNIELSRAIKDRSPNTLVVYRHHVSHQEPYYNTDNPLRTANQFLDTHRDALARNQAWIDADESLNEEVPTHNNHKLSQAVAFDVAFAQALSDSGIDVAPVLLCGAVGNPDHGTETELLIPAARAAVQHNGFLGYHAYFWANTNESGLDSWWRHHAGRALESWDPVFRRAGLYPRYIFGEFGAVGSNDGYALFEGQGWKHPGCMNENAERYLQHLKSWADRVNAWNADHNDRALGGTIFTTGIGIGWEYFQFHTYMMDRVRKAWL